MWRWTFALAGSLQLLSCSPPMRYTLDSASFPVSDVKIHFFRKGEPTIYEKAYAWGSEAPEDFQRMKGRFGPAEDCAWFVEVYPRIPEDELLARGVWLSKWANEHFAERVRKGILEARDGYSSDLAWTPNASPRIIPRFQRKRFPWGTAATFLVQYQNDHTNDVPCNGMLQYEVHGLTPDGHYLKARFGVTHPKLAQFGPKVREYSEGDPADPKSAIRRDCDYRLVEKCPASDFEPSLDEIDRFLGTLKVSGTKLGQ